MSENQNTTGLAPSGQNQGGGTGGSTVLDQNNGNAANSATPAGGSSVIPPVVKPDTVELPVADVKKLLETVDKQAKDIELLKELAGKTNLERMEQLRGQGKLVKTVKLNMIENKVIVGWTKVKDDVYFDQEGKLHEQQTIKVYFEDQTEKEMDYRTFSRIKTQQKAEVLSENKERDGATFFKVLLPDGKELTVDIKFLN